MCFGGSLPQYARDGALRRVERMIEEDDEKAGLVYESMALQIAKFIANLAASVCGRADAVIFTGGPANSKMLTEEIKRILGFIAPVMLYPEKNEMELLAHGAYRILKGDESARAFRYDQQQRQNLKRFACFSKNVALNEKTL